MPLDLPNPKLFKPHIPTAIDRHCLFGIKFSKVHRFQDTKWPQTSITEQYSLMSNCLKKNINFKKLKLNYETNKQTKSVQLLRQECSDGRNRIKNAYIGDLTAIRRILMSRKDLQRKYKIMPLCDIMVNCDQETFLRRKEKDRLKYQLDRFSNDLKNVLLQQSKLEDRIKYANEFSLQTELDAKICRKTIQNSQTRMGAYKQITRAYQRILSLLERDDIYFEQVLESIKGDIEEQHNFIQQIISLGVPAKEKYNKLADEFRIMDEKAREQMKNNTLFISQARKKLTKLQKDTKFVVRNYNPPKPRKYVRTTKSMDILQSNIEELERVINDIRLVTMSPDATVIEDTMKHLVNTCDNIEVKIKNDDKYQDILTDKHQLAVCQIAKLTHNYSQTEDERIQYIDDLQLQITYQQKLRQQTDSQIVNSANMLQILNYSLLNIVDVLRHVGKRTETISRDYPNIDLKLPLLKFDFFNIKATPPIQMARSSKKLLIIATDKITILVKHPLYKPKLTNQEIIYNFKMYNKDYLKTLEEDDGAAHRTTGLDGGDVFFSTKPNDGGILNRVNIKEISSKIVEKYTKDID